jgi:hypothetical protein
MRFLLLSMVIGVAAGIIDIIPMIIKKLDKRAIISAFLQYFFVSIIIVNISLHGIPWWLKGSIIAFAFALPVMIILPEDDKKALPVIAVMSIILGGLIGLAGHYLILIKA